MPKPLELLAAGALLILFFGGLGAIPYFEPDEGRYTEIPREMLALKDFVLPHLNGVLYFEKPPLYYWLNALSMAFLGMSEFASRFWSAALGLLGLIPVWALGRKMSGARAGLLSAAVLAASPLYLALAHLTIIDMTLTFFFTATLACYFLASVEEAPSKARWLWYAMFASAACTVLAKGLIGLVLPCGIVGATLLLSRDWRVLRRVPWVFGSALFLVLAAPWHILAAVRSPDFLWFYIVREHFLRFLTTVHDRTEPWWFFAPIVVWALLPWTALLFPSFWTAARSLLSRDSAQRRTPELFLWIWALVVIVFFSISKSKLIPYVLPALPPLATLAALEAERLLARGKASPSVKFGLVLTCLLTALFGGAFVWAGLGHVGAFGTEVHLSVAVAGGACAALALLSVAWCLASDWRHAYAAMFLAGAASFGCLWAAAPTLAQARNVKAFAQYIETHAAPGDAVFAYRFYPQTLPVYLRRPVGVVAFEGELAFGISKLDGAARAERFPSKEAFAALWNGPGRIWCVADRGGLKKFASDGLAPPVVLLEERQVVLVTNHPVTGGGGG